MKPEYEEFIISEALDSFPTAPLPEGFVANTMSRLEPRPLWQIWLDRLNRVRFLPTALGVFSFGFLALIGFLGWWGYRLINPLWLQSVFSEINYRLNWINARPVNQDHIYLIFLGLSVVLFLAGLVIAWVWTDPRKRYPLYLVEQKSI
jgi:hypothetical protein